MLFHYRPIEYRPNGRATTRTWRDFDSRPGGRADHTACDAELRFARSNAESVSAHIAACARGGVAAVGGAADKVSDVMAAPRGRWRTRRGRRSVGSDGAHRGGSYL